MRDRLIELLIKSGVTWNPGGVADLLLKNGVIVPPINVGDIAYKIYGYEILEVVVENVVIGLNPSKCIVYTKDNLMLRKEIWYQESFGEQLFFTKEQAEKALAEVTNGT